MKRKIAILLILITLCVIFSACTTKEWGEAPDLTLYDKYGNETKLSEFSGKGIVLNFWASWCPPCKKEMPDFEDLYKEYGDEVQFLMVNATSWEYNLQDGKKYIEEQGYTFPVYYDLNGEAPEAYDFDSIPRTFFIDKEGNIVKAHTGILSSAKLKEGIELIK